MSYILDALKRAERERDFGRGAVPGIHTATGADQGAESLARGRGLRATAPWAVALLCLALAAVVGWWALGRTAPRDAVQLAASNLPLAPAPAPAPVPASATVIATAVAPVASAPAAATAAAIAAPALPPVAASQKSANVPVLPAAEPASAATRRAERAAAREEAAARKAAEAKEARAKKEAASAAAQAAAVAAAATKPSPSPSAERSDSERIPAAAELPAELRAQLPVLTFSGVTYSENPLYRMVIVNGQVVQEKGSPAPGLTLERIQPRGAVLSFKGTRYRVSY